MFKLLVVDDDQGHLDEIAEGLDGREGWDIIYVLCSTPHRAIDAIEMHIPNVVLTDYQFSSEPGAQTGVWVAQTVNRYYSKQGMLVGTHTYRNQEEAREFFARCPYVTHFVGDEGGINYARLEDFMADCERILKTASR